MQIQKLYHKFDKTNHILYYEKEMTQLFYANCLGLIENGNAYFFSDEINLPCKKYMVQKHDIQFNKDQNSKLIKVLNSLPIKEKNVKIKNTFLANWFIRLNILQKEV